MSVFVVSFDSCKRYDDTQNELACINYFSHGFVHPRKGSDRNLVPLSKKMDDFNQKDDHVKFVKYYNFSFTSEFLYHHIIEVNFIPTFCNLENIKKKDKL